MSVCSRQIQGKYNTRQENPTESHLGQIKYVESKQTFINVQNKLSSSSANKNYRRSNLLLYLSN